ncbi:uncharacterized protein LOC128238559 [Mya arenaria]|nr:uncharacterized protein LOC128238559 [Mya arenaria]
MLAFAGANSNTFLQHLQRNVDEYRKSHFSWNIRNLDHNTYKSLRTIEKNKDRIFREFIQSQSHGVKHLPASEHMSTEKRTEAHLHNLSHGGSRTIQRTKQIPRHKSHGETIETRHARHLHTIMNNELLQKREEEQTQLMMVDIKGRNVSETRDNVVYAAPQIMMYGDKILPLKIRKRSANHPQMMVYNEPQMMVYNEPQMMVYNEPQMMMYGDKILPLKIRKRSVNHPQMMVYNEPQMMVYNEPQMMVYNEPQMMVYNEPQMMVYNEPQMMMYGDKILPLKNRKRSANHPQMMVYNEPQMMVYNEPQMMVYNEPQMMMYGDKILPLKIRKRSVNHPQMMVYNEPQMMVYNEPQMMVYNEPQMMVYNEPQMMVYNEPQMMVYNEPQMMVYNEPQMMVYNEPQMMMYGDKILPLKIRKRAVNHPQMMVYNEPQMMVYKEPQMMVYNEPQIMVYNEPQMMMYGDKILPLKIQKRLANHPQMMVYNKPQMMVYNEPQMMVYNEPQMMMYGDKILPLKIRKRSANHPQMMVYNEPQMMVYNEPQMMVYNEPQMMVYNEPQMMVYNEPQMMVYNEPQMMMYGNKMLPLKFRKRSANHPQMMVYNEPQMMVYNEPQMMVYNEPQMMVYNEPQIMVYNEPQNMAYNAPQIMVYDEPQRMIYNEPQKMVYYEPQMMMYGDKKIPSKIRKRSANRPHMMVFTTPKSMRYNGKFSYLSIRSFEKQQNNNTLNTTNSINTKLENFESDKYLWFSIADSLSLRFPVKESVYFNSWSQRILLFKNSTLNKDDFTKHFHRLPLQKMLQTLSLTHIFQHIFWPFSFDQAFMNQKLALLGMSGLSTNRHKQKEAFYAELEKHQTIKVPVEEENVILSFDHPDLVEGLNRSGLLELSKEYVDAGNHLYSLEEQEYITSKVQAAMDMIKITNSELYRAIHQVIGCIAFYKAEHRGFAGGTISSALGVIWQDPRAYREQSVAHYAEQIVHEFIHSSLFLADMVHGTYIDRSLLSHAKVYSPVRRELRDFDKTFHASYVTTGVTIFQSRAGNFEKAKTYAGSLRTAVDGLIAIQKAVGVLNESGAAMLQSMDDVLTVIRME